jgi:hypothetical protein
VSHRLRNAHPKIQDGYYLATPDRAIFSVASGIPVAARLISSAPYLGCGTIRI